MRRVRVNLTKYVATEAGLRYCPAVITSNGRIKQDIVLVGDKEERHPEGAYYLDWRRNGVRVRLSVGKNAQDALTQRDRRMFELNAAAHGVELASSAGPNGSSPNDGRKPLSVRHNAGRKFDAVCGSIQFERPSVTLRERILSVLAH